MSLIHVDRYQGAVKLLPLNFLQHVYLDSVAVGERYFFQMTNLQQRLAHRQQQHLFRDRQTSEAGQGVYIRIGSQSFLNFSSNDYLGLAADPRVSSACQKGMERYGVGAGASHLITGHTAAHHHLEEELAQFVGAERALLFSTGYMANLAVASVLLGRKDILFEDKLNHASLLDGARLSAATIKRYPHSDTARLASLLETAPSSCQKMIMSDGVFSMDGDLAPVTELNSMASRFNAWLLIDDAHGLGVVGATGGGSYELSGLKVSGNRILMGTLGKALGTFGAFVAGDSDIIELLIQEARTYIYTTALPPCLAEATRESLRIVRQEPEKRDHLQKLITAFRRGAEELGLSLMSSETAIQPMVLGDSERALQASNSLRSKGILVSAIRPPTVPVGTARLRITLSALHDMSHVAKLLEALAEIPTS